MLQIDYDGKRFTVSTQGYIERDSFFELIDTLKKLELSFNKKLNSYVISNKDIEEYLLWFDRYGLKYFITDKALLRLQEIQESYNQKEVKFFRSKKFDPSVLNEGITCYQFQEQILDWKMKRSAYLDACDSGTGKTFTTIANLACLYNYKDIDGIVILAPNGLEYHWQREILKFTNQFNEDEIILIGNENKKDVYNLNKDKKVLIISNHIWKDVCLYYKKGFKLGSSAALVRWKEGGFCDIKEEWNKQNLAIVLDEAHMFKNWEAIKVKALFANKKHFDYRFELSATPNITRYEDIYCLAKFIDNSLIPMSWRAFSLWIAELIGKELEKINLRYAVLRYNTERVAQVRESLKKVTIQKLKKDIPEIKVKKIIEPIYLQMSDLQKVLYQQVAEEELKQLYEEYDTITEKLVTNKFPLLKKVVSCPEYLKTKSFDNDTINKSIQRWNFKKDPKILALDSILENVIDNQGEKIIISDNSPFILDMLYEYYKDKYNPLIIHGDQKVKNKREYRQECVDLFNTDPKYKIFLLSSLTSSVGLNLQKMCSKCLFYSMPSSLEYWQMQDRTARVNSEKDTTIYYFTYPDTIDGYMVYKTLNRVELTENFGKPLTQQELTNLLRGIV